MFPFLSMKYQTKDELMPTRRRLIQIREGATPSVRKPDWCSALNDQKPILLLTLKGNEAGYPLNPKQALADKLLGLVFVYRELFEGISQFFPRFLQFSKNRF